MQQRETTEKVGKDKNMQQFPDIVVYFLVAVKIAKPHYKQVSAKYIRLDYKILLAAAKICNKIN